MKFQFNEAVDHYWSVSLPNYKLCLPNMGEMYLHSLLLPPTSEEINLSIRPIFIVCEQLHMSGFLEERLVRKVGERDAHWVEEFEYRSKNWAAVLDARSKPLIHKTLLGYNLATDSFKLLSDDEYVKPWVACSDHDVAGFILSVLEGKADPSKLMAASRDMWSLALTDYDLIRNFLGGYTWKSKNDGSICVEQWMNYFYFLIALMSSQEKMFKVQ